MLIVLLPPRIYPFHPFIYIAFSTTTLLETLHVIIRMALLLNDMKCPVLHDPDLTLPYLPICVFILVTFSSLPLYTFLYEPASVSLCGLCYRNIFIRLSIENLQLFARSLPAVIVLFLLLLLLYSLFFMVRNVKLDRHRGNTAAYLRWCYIDVGMLP